MSSNDCHKPYTNRDKWAVAITFGLLFLVISSPYTYGLSDALFSTIGLDTAHSTSYGAVPTVIGLIIHAIIFVLILRLLMK
jgi:hypothetical protein